MQVADHHPDHPGSLSIKEEDIVEQIFEQLLIYAVVVLS